MKFFFNNTKKEMIAVETKTVYTKIIYLSQIYLKVRHLIRNILFAKVLKRD